MEEQLGRMGKRDYMNPAFPFVSGRARIYFDGSGRTSGRVLATWYEDRTAKGIASPLVIRVRAHSGRESIRGN